jgi:hypothetical protein
MPSTFRWNFSGFFSITAAYTAQHTVIFLTRKGVSWPAPYPYQQACQLTRPAGNRPASSSSKWSSISWRSSSSRLNRSGALRGAWQHSKPACSSVRATLIVPPHLIGHMRNTPPALMPRIDRALSRGIPGIGKRCWRPQRSSRLCLRPVSVGSRSFPRRCPTIYHA